MLFSKKARKIRSGKTTTVAKHHGRVSETPFFQENSQKISTIANHYGYSRLLSNHYYAVVFFARQGPLGLDGASDEKYFCFLCVPLCSRGI